jgi:tRNA U34 5-carboxymethylaminomethyl modifying GTPase MnmE/TrmE
LRAVAGNVRNGVTEEVVLVDLYRAANALGRLVGAITHGNVMGEIFSKFCIGK